MRRSRVVRAARPLALVVAMLLLASGLADGASAAAPAKLWKSCLAGSEAGRCRVPRGIATDPTNGHLYVSDQNNERIVELNAWGVFVQAFGWGVANGEAKLQSCGPGATPPTASCQAATGGTKAGQFGSSIGPEGIAPDAAGDLYVVDTSNHRVQKFSPTGEFILMFGANVNKTKVEEGGATQAEKDLCTKASGDECQAGTTGTANGEFSEWPIASFIAADPAGTTMLVGDKERIEEFNTDGTFKALFPDPEEKIKTGGSVSGLAVDPAGNAYLTFAGKSNVLKLDSSGVKQCEATVTTPTAVAVDDSGHLYAVDSTTSPPSILEFNATDCTSTGTSFGSDELTNTTTFPITGLATGEGCHSEGADVYVANWSPGGANSFIRAYGPPPDEHTATGEVCEPPKAPPAIDSQEVIAATTESSTVQAQINPRFWADATYYVEFGTGNCSEGGCTQKLPASPASLGGGVTGKDFATAGITLPTPLAGTTYHYRFVSESSGGGPVYGTDPDGPGPKEATFAEGEERTFTTFGTQPPPPPSDGRAYEQVSPLGKGGYDVDKGLVLARPDGGTVIYGSVGAYADPPEGAVPGTYVATREVTDWQNTALGARYEPAALLLTAPVLGISGDFGKQLVATNAKLTPDAVGDDNAALNFYVHDNLTNSYQYVATAHDESLPISEILNLGAFAGASYDGSSFYFSLREPLNSTPAPPPGSGNRLYGFDTATGQLSYLGVLPDESLDLGGSLAAGAERVLGASDIVAFHPVSDDGQRVYWTHKEAAPLYLRKPGHTTLVSKRQEDGSAQNADLWGTSADGRYAFLTSAGKLTEGASPTGSDLYRYDDESKAASKLTDLTPDLGDAGGAGVSKVLGVSEDGAYAYFIATGNMAAGASGSKPKIYAWHEGAVRLVGELASEATQLTFANTSDELWRVSPNGRYLGFLFGGAVGGAHPQESWPHRQAYLYDYEADTLDCASCPPQGFASGDVGLHGGPRTAASISSLVAYETGISRNVTNAGQFFFDSPDRLLLADTNEATDVYEYSSADHEVHLISSGTDPHDSFFGDATPSGSDAFFLTRQNLVLRDEDELTDLYDARIGGGIPSQNEPPPIPCDPSTNCQHGLTEGDNGPGPGSSSFSGPGNKPPNHNNHHKKHKAGKKKKHKKHRAKRHARGGHR